MGRATNAGPRNERHLAEPLCVRPRASLHSPVASDA